MATYQSNMPTIYETQMSVETSNTEHIFVPPCLCFKDILVPKKYGFCQEPMKRSVRVESTWVVTHGYMRAIVRIFLYSYP
jgi:hypothetical protein